MYTYIHMYILVHMYIYIHVYVCMYIYVYIHVSLYIHLSILMCSGVSSILQVPPAVSQRWSWLSSGISDHHRMIWPSTKLFQYVLTGKCIKNNLLNSQIIILWPGNPANSHEPLWVPVPVLCSRPWHIVVCVYTYICLRGTQNAQGA